ncbi:MAG: hypothetical protein ACRECV_05405 [Xanthobacteraceae bacterium]
MRCAYCARPVEPKATWKGSGDRFYCSEFCADAETPEVSASPAAPPTLLDLHRQRSYERLERLLPYMRAYSGRAAAATGTRIKSGQKILNRVA